MLCLTASRRQVIPVLLTKHLWVPEDMIPHGHHYSGLPRDGLWATVTGNFGPFLRESRSSGTRLSAKHTLQREPTPGKELRCSSSIFVLSAWLALLSPWWVSPSQAPNAKLHPCAVHPNPGWAPAWAQAKGESCWHKWWSRKKNTEGFSKQLWFTNDN